MASGRLAVVGGGVLGAMHCLEALRRGWEVVHLEKDDEPRGASVRNFGLIWVSGRAGGPELSMALRARALWERVAAECPGVGLRANGSLTVARTPAERAVLEEAAGRPDAAERRLTLLDAAAARRCNPELGGPLLAALHCAADAVVEPRRVPGALRATCSRSDRYRWLPGTAAVEVGDGSVRDATGRWHRADRVVLCVGAERRGLGGELLAGSPVRRVRLQMLETEPFGGHLTTSLADGDSLRYYPAFAGAALRALPAQAEVAARWAAQLLLVQRAHGGLTIGDTHVPDEPFPFTLAEAPYRHLWSVARDLLGAEPPPVAERWAGVYSQLTEHGAPAVYLRRPVARDVEVVTGAGGRGMTLSPAIAEETFA